MSSSSNNNQISVSDIVNAKIVDLLLECCRKTVMECAYHYKFDAQEALGKMGLLTDYSALTNLTMSSVNMTMSLSGMNSETGSVSDVSAEGGPGEVVVKDDISVKTKVLPEEEGKKGKAKKEKVVKEKVVKEKKAKAVKVVEKVGVDVEKVEVGVDVEVKEDDNKSEAVSEISSESKKVKKEKVVKEKVVKEKVVKEKVVKEKKAKAVKETVAVSVPVAIVKEVLEEGEVQEEEKSVAESEISSGSESESKKKGRPKKEPKEPKVPKEKKGRPKKVPKETESNSAIDDLFANLVAKDTVKEEVKEEVKEVVKEVVEVKEVVKEEVKKQVNEVVVSKPESQTQVPKVDVVNKIEFQGTTYLKSKNTGIIYNMEQDVVGKWNENTMTIDFDEEEEEEYEDE